MNWTEVLFDQNIGIDIGTQFGATLVGVFLGFGLALWYDRKKKKGARQEKIKHVIDSITEEMKEISKLTKGEIVQKSELMDWNESKALFEGKKFTLTTPSFKSAVNSGDFILLPNGLQTKISNVYSRIDDCQSAMERIENYYSTPIFTTSKAKVMGQNLRKNLDTNLGELKNEFKRFWSYFESNENKLKLV